MTRYEYDNSWEAESQAKGKDTDLFCCLGCFFIVIGIPVLIMILEGIKNHGM